MFKTKAIILGADSGTKSLEGTSKILLPICGTPLIKFLISSVREAGIDDISVVVSPGMEQVADLIAPHELFFQEHHLGTGNAVLTAEKNLQPFDGCVLVLLGDTPLIRPETIQKMIQKCEQGADVVVLAFLPTDLRRYGRLVMCEEGLEKIVEYLDATDAERSIRLCNSGAMCLSGRHALELIKKINNDNAAGQYYLTDIVGLAKKQGLKIDIVMGSVEELHGINSKEELEAAEELFLKCNNIKGKR